MNFEEIKKNILNFIVDQLPVLAKLFKIEPTPTDIFDDEVENGDIDDDDDFIAENDEQEFQEDLDEDIELDSNNHNTETDIDTEIDNPSGLLEESEEVKKAKRKKYITYGIRGLVAVVIIYVVIDDIILKKDPAPAQVQSEQQQIENLSNEEVAPASVEESVVGTFQDIESQGDMDSVVEITETVPDDESDIMDNSSDEELLPIDEYKDVTVETPESAVVESELDTTTFDNKGYEKSAEDNKAEEALIDVAGYTDITASELKEEIEESKSAEDIAMSPEDDAIEGVSLAVLRELEEKLKQKELSLDQDLSGEKEDLSLRGKKAPLVDYYRSGRGLVFNCIGGHWACVDEVAYINCRDAHKINDSQRASSTCQPHNVYISEKDCQRSQYDLMTEEKGQATCDK